MTTEPDRAARGEGKVKEASQTNKKTKVLLVLTLKTGRTYPAVSKAGDTSDLSEPRQDFNLAGAAASLIWNDAVRPWSSHAVHQPWSHSCFLCGRYNVPQL